MSRLRIRTIKPDCWADEAISPCSRDARLLFAVLITLADDDGRLRDLPAQIIGHGYPEDNDATARKVTAWMDELVATGIVVRYTAGGKGYATFPKWHKHQRINRYTRSHLPPCLTAGVVIVPHKSEEQSGSPHDGCDEDSMSSHGAFTEDSRPDRECGAGSVEIPLTPASGGTSPTVPVDDPAPVRPSGKRQRDAVEYEAAMAAWAAKHFPAVDPRCVSATVSQVRRSPDAGITAAELEREARRRGGVWLSQLGLTEPQTNGKAA